MNMPIEAVDEKGQGNGELFTEIGLANPKGALYKERFRKERQLEAYLVQMKAVLRKLPKKRMLYLLDCGCGRSYLSFYLNYHLQKEGWTNLSFIGIDSNPELIRRCELAAKKLNFTNMAFHHGNIIDSPIGASPDIVYSLHACDTATDQMIARGIKESARFILSVSCCQHTLHSQIKKHPLKTFSQFRPYKERLVDMMADTIRGCILQSRGYDVNIFEFVTTQYTPKNIMLRAQRTVVTEENAMDFLSEGQELMKLFHLRPELVDLLDDEGRHANVLATEQQLVAAGERA